MEEKNDKHIEVLGCEPQVIYEDNHLLVVVKPHRALVQSDSSGSPTLFLQICNWLKIKYQKPGNVFLGLVHRLDRPASGLMVFAKTSKAASRLSEQIRSRKMEKKYEVIVEGVPSAVSGTLIHYLKSPEGLGPTQVFSEEAEGTKKAELSYEVLEQKEGQSLVEINLKTGRRHQIRAQLSHLGCPVRGDGRYGAKNFFQEGSVALVATQLSFLHPTNQKTMNFTLPEELNSVRQFWKHGKP